MKVKCIHNAWDLDNAKTEYHLTECCTSIWSYNERRYIQNFILMMFSGYKQTEDTGNVSLAI